MARVLPAAYHYEYQLTLEVPAMSGTTPGARDGVIDIDRGGDFYVERIMGIAFKYSGGVLTSNEATFFKVMFKSSGQGRDWMTQEAWSYLVLSHFGRNQLNNLRKPYYITANNQVFVNIYNYENTAIQLQISLQGYRTTAYNVSRNLV